MSHSGGWVSIPSCQGLVIRPWTVGWWLLLLWHLLLTFLLPDIQEDGQKICIWILNILPRILHFVSHLNLNVVANSHSLTPKALGSTAGSMSCNLSEWRWWGKSGRGVPVLRELKRKSWKTIGFSLRNSWKESMYVVVNANCPLCAQKCKLAQWLIRGQVRMLECYCCNSELGAFGRQSDFHKELQEHQGQRSLNSV